MIKKKWVNNRKVEYKSLHRVMEELIKSSDYARLITKKALEAGEKIKVVYNIDVESKVIQLRVEKSRRKVSIPTFTEIFPYDLFRERGVMEFFGIKFKDHFQFKHLFLPDHWPDSLYPLMKDRAIRQITEKVDK